MCRLGQAGAGDYLTDKLTDHALGIIERERKQPFFHQSVVSHRAYAHRGQTNTRQAIQKKEGGQTSQSSRVRSDGCEHGRKCWPHTAQT